MVTSSQTDQRQIYQCKVSLKGLIPPIWRKIQVSGDIRLDEFHRVLQIVMGWGNYHSYRFIIDGAMYGPLGDVFADATVRSAHEVRLSQVAGTEGSRFIYLYDLADDWQHVVKVEKILAPKPGVQYPICRAGQRACPPEECGGIWEYTNLLEILQDPRHPEHREIVEPYGGDFDPEVFDLVRVNRALQPIREAQVRKTKEIIPIQQWTEADSRLYQEIAAVAVPAREEQISALLTLLPFSQADSFRAVELGCGEGFLSHALLDCFPQAQVVALDGSAEMRAQAAARLSDFGSRALVEPFDLNSGDWLSHLEGADCIVSSLVVHHLDGEQKQRLFAAIYERLSAQGVLLIADLIQPQRPEAGELFAATWDRSAEAQALAKTGSRQLFEQFVKTEWNHYRFPDPFDKPSSLFEQLTWLKAAGFAVVDCFWLQAGHAIYGGYKAVLGDSSVGVSFTTALRSVQAALHRA
ncbi:MAG: methyltransferase [Anaerolineales bacterium]|nr:methyltransferase [Anaerolineales bacterium]